MVVADVAAVVMVTVMGISGGGCRSRGTNLQDIRPK